MKVKNFMKKFAAFALGLGMTVGVSYGLGNRAHEVDAAANPDTPTLEFTAACNGNGTDDSGIKWTVSSDAAESNFDNTKGVHYGTSSKAISYLTLTSEAYSRPVTKVEAYVSDANKTATITVKVNENDFGTSQEEKNYNNTCYTFTPTAAQSASNFTGSVEVKLSRASAKKALYCKKIIVTLGTSDSPSCEHTYVSNNKAATCTEAGFTEEVCSKCQDVKNHIDIDALGHNFVNGVCTRCHEAQPQGYELVTDASTLKAGDIVVLGATNGTKSYINGIKNGDFLNSIETSLEGTTLATIDGVSEFTLGGESGAWTLTSSEGVLGATAVKKLSFDQGASNYIGTWTISIDADNKATLGPNADGYGRFLYNTGSPRFLTYTSNTSTSMLLPSLYRKPSQVCGHINKVSHSAVAATCTTAGNELYYTCPDCDIVCLASDGETVLDEIPVIAALGHNMDSGVVTTEATCTTAGEKLYSCQRTGCTHTTIEVIPALGHDWGDYSVITEPTCTEPGYGAAKCERCGEESSSAEIPALGHDWDDGVETTAPTCTEDGVMTYTCERAGCGATKTEPIAKLGHDWGEWTQTTAPTCTAAGVETRTCKRGGCTASETRPVSATGHSFGEWVTTTDPTCTEAGEQTKYCQHSGCTETETQPVAALGHNYVNGVCSRCGADEPLSFDISLKTIDSSLKTATADLMEWDTEYVKVTNEKNGGTDANNYYPGTPSKTYTSTRFYNKNILTFTPLKGITICSVEFTATSEGYATALRDSTWTKATAVANGTVVVVTPTEGDSAFSAGITATCGFENIKITYSLPAGPAKVLDSLELSGNYQTTFEVGETFSTDGLTVTAVYQNADPEIVSLSDLSISNPDMSEKGTKTITVSLTNEFGYAEASYSINVVKTIKNPIEGDWELLTDASQITNNSRIVLANVNNAVTMGDLVDTKDFTSLVDSSFEEDNIQIGEGTLVLTLSRVDGGYNLITSEGEFLGHKASSLVIDDGETSGANYVWTISVSDNKASIAGSNNNVIRYNTNSPRFKTYTSATGVLPEVYIEYAAEAHEITWSINGVETKEQYSLGEMPVHASPENYEDDEFTYVFVGWDPEIVAVTGDATYTAMFDKVVKEAYAPIAEQTLEPVLDEDNQPIANTFKVEALAENGVTKDNAVIEGITSEGKVAQGGEIVVKLDENKVFTAAELYLLSGADSSVMYSRDLGATWRTAAELATKAKRATTPAIPSGVNAVKFTVTDADTVKGLNLQSAPAVMSAEASLYMTWNWTELDGQFESVDVTKTAIKFTFGFNSDRLNEYISSADYTVKFMYKYADEIMEFSDLVANGNSKVITSMQCNDEISLSISLSTADKWDRLYSVTMVVVDNEGNIVDHAGVISTTFNDVFCDYYDNPQAKGLYEAEALDVVLGMML